MDGLSEEGFDAYVATGILSAGLIRLPPHVLGERLGCLQRMIASDGNQERVVAAYVDDFLSWGRFGYTVQAEGNWWDWDPVDDLDESPAVRPRRGARVAVHDPERGGEASWRAPEPPTPAVLHFVVPAAGHRLKRTWEFHKTDPDPYPSVPHGHERKGSRTSEHIKLDAYRGWIFDRGNRVDREPRRAVESLWNDAAFRRFAAEALDHALAADVSLARRLRDERGVERPRSLPRKR